jgi:hypothetical protein
MRDALCRQSAGGPARISAADGASLRRHDGVPHAPNRSGHDAATPGSGGAGPGLRPEACGFRGGGEIHPQHRVCLRWLRARATRLRSNPPRSWGIFEIGGCRPPQPIVGARPPRDRGGRRFLPARQSSRPDRPPRARGQSADPRRAAGSHAAPRLPPQSVLRVASWVISSSLPCSRPLVLARSLEQIRTPPAAMSLAAGLHLLLRVQGRDRRRAARREESTDAKAE